MKNSQWFKELKRCEMFIKRHGVDYAEHYATVELYSDDIYNTWMDCIMHYRMLEGEGL